MIQVKLHKRKASLFKYDDMVNSTLVSSSSYYGYNTCLYVNNGCELSETSSFFVIDVSNVAKLLDVKRMFKQVDYSELDNQLSDIGINLN